MKIPRSGSRILNAILLLNNLLEKSARTRSIACMAIAGLIFGAGIFRAQDTAVQTKPKGLPENVKFSSTTELMEVHAVVTDKKGNLIENLAKEDFELLENGKPQNISFFSVSKIDNGPSRPMAPEEPIRDQAAEARRMGKRLSEIPARTTLFYVDNVHLTFSSLNRVKQVIRRFINERLTGQDMVALATSAGTLGIAQQFSRDQNLLQHAIEQIRFNPARAGSYFTPRIAAEVINKQDMALATAVNILKGEEDHTFCCADWRNLALIRASQIITEDALNRVTMLSILRDYAEQMIRLPGQRMMVIFSDGFTLYDRDGTSHDSELQTVINRAVRSGVTIYSIDAKGLESLPTVDASKKYVPKNVDENQVAQFPGPEWCDSQAEDLCRMTAMEPDQVLSYVLTSQKEALNGMHTLAEQTGGRMFTDTNDLGGALTRAFDANRFSYVLSYYLNSEGDPRSLRDIRVRVRNHPEYTVRTPRRFAPLDAMAKQEDLAAKTPQQRLLQAMNAPLPKTDINVSARAEFVETASDDKQVTLFVYFDGDRLNYKSQHERNLLELEVLYTIYDSSGKQVDAVSAAVEGNLADMRREQAQKKGYLFSRRLPLKPGVYQARVGIRESGTDLIGTATAWMEVPEMAPDKLEMSSLILRNPLDDNLESEDGVHVSDLEQVKMVQGIPLYARGDFCDYFFRIFPGAPSTANAEFVVMQELLQNDKVIRTGTWQSVAEEAKYKDSKGWFDVGGEVDLKGLNPGIYELRVRVKNAQSEKMTHRSTVFSIDL